MNEIENSIKNVGTVKELCDFLTKKKETDPELYEKGLVAISTRCDRKIEKGALYSITISVGSGTYIVFVPDELISC